MRVTVQDHYGFAHEPQTFEGTPYEVERALRERFRGVIGHVPFGDLAEVIRTLRVLGGIDIAVQGEAPGLPKRAGKTVETTDPRIHEIDYPGELDKDNL